MPATILLRARLPDDRVGEGVFWVESDWGGGIRPVYGPVRCRGHADLEAAVAHHNAVEDPTQAYGNHPSGHYAILGWVASTPESAVHYGPAFVRLDPRGGEALEAKHHGRGGIGIHGGPPLADGMLRPTYGCLRVEDQTVEFLMQTLPGTPGPGDELDYVCDTAPHDLIDFSRIPPSVVA